MPPMRNQNRQKLAQQEGPLLLAIRAIEKGEIKSIREAARIFNVPRSTLRGRVNGQTFRPDTRANNHILTVQEEESLVKWIFDLDYRGQAPQQCMVREMADILLAERVSKASSKRPAQVGKNWVTGFVRRQPKLQSRFSRKYNYQRAQNEDPEVIRAWFDKVHQTICRYGITDADIYNFDETGFAIGVTATSKVVTRSEYYGKRAVAEPGNREWVTAIECIGSGFALDPYIIFKGRVFIQGWFEYLPKGWRLDKSENGWTTNEIGLRWLSESFIPQTKSRRQGRWLLLILDGHSSHLTPRFHKLCAENDIIAICMPAHSSHILQPLDIGCFAPLKRSYGRIVDRWMRAGVDFVDKLEFLSNYPEARSDAFTFETIQNSFRAAGLLPYNPTESQYSFYADSDLGLNPDILHSDDISALISSQTVLTSVSQVSSLTAPLSLPRVGPPLQQYWVLYSSKPSREMDESRKSFVTWWLNTEFGSKPDIQDSIRWDGKKTSNIWDNFNQVAHEKTGKPKVMCTTCLCTLVHPRFRRAGSSPMNAHIKAGSCTRKPVQKIDQMLKQMPTFPQNPSFSQERLAKAILDFISTAHLPFRIIEHTQFKDLVEVIQQAPSKVNIPSARSMRRYLDSTVKSSQKEILRRLPDRSRLSIALDCWTSPFQQAFMAVTGYFLDQDWNYCEVLLGFEHLHGSHTGENLSKTVIQLLTDHEITDRVLSVTTDNATNNNTLMMNIQETIQSQSRSDTLIFRVPCIAHVIQLSLNELLGKLKVTPPNKEIELEWSDERTHSFQTKQSSSTRQIADTLKKSKIRGLAVFINASPQRREAFMALQTKEPRLIPIQDVQTRWNSTFMMLNRAKRLQPFYDQYCTHHQYLHFKLDQEEWRQIEYLLLLTKPFFDFTTMLSKTRDVTTHNIYSIYNKLFSHLDEAERKLKNKGVIWKKSMLQALQTAKKKLSKYYTATDHESYGEIYALATILCPSKKLRYFASTDWQGEIDYVKHYHGVLKREFHRYKDMLHHDSDTMVVQDATGEARDDDYYDLDTACASQNQPQDKLSKPEDDEIARYLARGIERQKPRAFWKEHENEFPILARMARDILSIPASGAGVERLFNCARDICHYRRGQLKPSTIRGLMLHQLATKFEVEQKEFEVIKEHLSAGEAVLLDQARKPIPQLETVEPISDNEEEEQELGIEDTQRIESYDENSEDGKTDNRSKQLQLKRSRKRLSEASDDDDDGLPEMLIDEGIQGRSGRIRKQPRLPDGFQFDLR
ncbi:hypothetical protein N7508_007366 [Penicillium antarcticum]|uniref:uncharacterized protein n=1 Tax=Penicillium antarcticum TaxID=416450 RepID=UPI0023894822|nr:uncharacterized protein N7508_007366 [Penicillium antarcticum]KAJ5300123.1 hypothetical protein N7508_007366 [Penicillium antarcticum]